jgi:hypothetical protein
MWFLVRHLQRTTFPTLVVMGDKALVLLGAREFLLRAMTG